MSADNYVAVLKCNDGYRVTHCQAIENLYYWPTGRVLKNREWHPETDTYSDIPEYEERASINPDVLKDYFSDSKKYTKKQAFEKAVKLYEEIGYVEYGIIEINFNGDFPQ